MISDVFFAFLRLGFTAFGGPVAHIGYFRDEFVERRKWLNDEAYADVVALCQFLPGPASSQVGLAIGMLKAGPWGALAAWTGFTLPSAILMTAAALSLVQLGEAIPPGLLEGLKAVVVAVVAHALIGMARSLTPDIPRLVLAVFALAVTLYVGGVTGQLIAIGAGIAIGLVAFRSSAVAAEQSADFVAPIPKPVSLILLVAFAVLLFGLPFLASHDHSLAIQIADGFYRSGALVFGGGHVVLPLLQAETVVPGLVGATEFTAGYGLAQAVPGPLFTFSAFSAGRRALTRALLRQASMHCLPSSWCFCRAHCLSPPLCPIGRHCAPTKLPARDSMASMQRWLGFLLLRSTHRLRQPPSMTGLTSQLPRWPLSHWQLFACRHGAWYPSEQPWVWLSQQFSEVRHPERRADVNL